MGQTSTFGMHVAYLVYHKGRQRRVHENRVPDQGAAFSNFNTIRVHPDLISSYQGTAKAPRARCRAPETPPRHDTKSPQVLPGLQPVSGRQVPKPPRTNTRPPTVLTTEFATWATLAPLVDQPSVRAAGRPRRPPSARRPSYAYARAPREAAGARGPEYRPNRPPSPRAPACPNSVPAHLRSNGRGDGAARARGPPSTAPTRLVRAANGPSGGWVGGPPAADRGRRIDRHHHHPPPPPLEP